MDAIARVDCLVSPVFRVLHTPLAQKRRPVTASDAKFSIPYAVATALHTGSPGLAAFAPDALTDARTLEIADKVHCSTADAWDFDASLRGELTVTLHNGTTWTVRVDRPLGDPLKPLDAAALQQKFRDCAGYAANPLESADAVIAAVEGLDAAADLSALRL